MLPLDTRRAPPRRTRQLSQRAIGSQDSASACGRAVRSHDPQTLPGSAASTYRDRAPRRAVEVIGWRFEGILKAVTAPIIYDSTAYASSIRQLFQDRLDLL